MENLGNLHFLYVAKKKNKSRQKEINTYKEKYVPLKWIKEIMKGNKCGGTSKI